MLDLELIMQQIEEKQVEELTTKELKENGLNKYYIKKAVDLGKLEKIKKGHYQVVKTFHIKKRNFWFNKFIQCVFKNDYKGAYQALTNNLDHQVNHDYDNDTRTFLILLSKILNYSLESIQWNEQLLEFSNFYPERGNYYSYFIKFRENVEISNFSEAYLNLEKFKREEKMIKGSNSISTELFMRLTRQILFQEQSQIEKQRINYRRLYRVIFEKFLNAYQQENYEEAIFLLRDAIPFSSNYDRGYLKQLIRLLTDYLEIKNTDKVLVVEELTVEVNESNYQQVLKQVLTAKNYLTANTLIDKCLSKEPNNTFFKLFQEILWKITIQNEKNQEKLKTKSIEFPKETIKEPPQDITMESIYELVYNRDYEKLTNTFQTLREEDRLYYYMKIILKARNDINKTKIELMNQNHCYQNNQTDIFKRFYEALRHHDYEEAYQCALVCEQIAQKRDTQDKEFTIYCYMLEDLLEELKDYPVDKERYQQQKEIQEQFSLSVRKRGFTQEDLKELYQLFIQKLELNEKEEDNIYDQYGIQLLETLELIQNNQLTSIYFDQFEYDNNDLVSTFHQAMSLGDYETCFHIITTAKWFELTKNDPYKSYFMLYKKLLVKIHWACKCNLKLRYKSDNRKIEETSPTIIHLEMIKKLVKKSDYIGAYEYYQEYLKEVFSPSKKEVLDHLLLLTRQIQIEEDLQQLLEEEAEPKQVEILKKVKSKDSN